MNRPALPPPLRRLWCDETGVSVIEFALIAPALLMVLLGLMDLAYNIYTTTLLEGAIQQAGRNSTIEGAGTRTSQIDSRLRSVVRGIAPNATIAINRRAYEDYSDVGRPEDYTDTNADGACNAGEPFEDINGNGTWDSDRGRADTGASREAVLLTVTVSYPRMFPVMNLLGFSPDVSTTARTVLRNQPFAPQDRVPAVGNCE